MTEKKTDAWMPLWIGAYLADTQHLARDEHGGYLLLLMAYWRAQAPLPDDDKRLSAIVKATPKEWRVLRPVLAEFFTVEEGVWRHKRVEQELAGSQARKTKAQDKAKAAAEARWKQAHGDAPSTAQSNAPSTPQALHEQCPTPSPTPIPSLREGRKARGAPPCPEGVSEQVWADWLQLRRKKRADVSETTVAGAEREAAKAGISLQRFLEIWCLRGSQGLQAEWLRADERGPSRPTETVYQQSQRERVAEFAPGVAKRPAAIEMESVNVIAIAGR